MKKQTAVEWLIEQWDNWDLSIKELFEQAKEMEKEQIIMAYKADLHPCSDEDAEQYYNETYGKDKAED
jgi:hypothetical protein